MELTDVQKDILDKIQEANQYVVLRGQLVMYKMAPRISILIPSCKFSGNLPDSSRCFTRGASAKE